MNAVATTPGLYFTIAPRPAEASPLRSDVAGFVGRTRRGPVGQPIRVEGWRGYLREFGGLFKDSSTTYAIRGYFENEGEVAYVVRLCGDGAKTASATWKVGELDDQGRWAAASPATFTFAQYRIEATSPGVWANDTRVMIRYCLQGASGSPEVDVAIQAPYEPTEYFAGLPVDVPEGADATEIANALQRAIESQSLLIRLIPQGPRARRDSTKPGPNQKPGPNHLSWELTLQGGTEVPPSKQDYLDAALKLGEGDKVELATAPSIEVALVAVPGLYEDLKSEDLKSKAEQEEVLFSLIEQAERLHDRLVLVDVPTDAENTDDAIKEANEAIQWIAGLRNQVDEKVMRAAAVYHPRLWVPDPLGGIAKPLHSVPPSGHVAGLISRLDRQRGAHHTPANAPLFEAVDVTRTFGTAEQVRFHDEGINLVRCFPGRGLLVWGGRTPEREQTGRFVAHRRLIHRLVRAIRRVAEPLVFDINGPELWLTIVRAITTVLLEAYRAGALKGARPEDAFRVRCDETTTPPEEQDLGRVFCAIELAPAVPMEFILLRVALSSEGMLEVFES
jgi:phage tail sheath protein FI